MAGELILGLTPQTCDGVYPRTRDGRCHGCVIEAPPQPDMSWAMPEGVPYARGGS